MHAVNLTAVLPKLEPYNRNTKKEFDRFGLGRKVRISIESTISSLADDMYYRNVMKDLVENTEMEAPSGLTVYRNQTYPHNDVYISKNGNKINAAFYCDSSNDSITSSTCSRHIYFDDIYISYSYSREYLENWDEIHTNLLRLIDSFKAEEKEIPRP